MLRRLAFVSLVAAALTSCGSNPKLLELRLWSDSYAFRVTVDPMPPKALEPILYRIVVQDKKTGQPIETGEGRIFATSADRANTSAVAITTDAVTDSPSAPSKLGRGRLREK